MMWVYGDIKDRFTWGTSNTQHEKCSWFVPMKKILLFISDWYFDLSIGTLEGFLQRSNLLKNFNGWPTFADKIYETMLMNQTKLC